MKPLWRIGILSACVAAISGALVVWWVHSERAIEWTKFSEAASETRAHAEQGDANAEFMLARMYAAGKDVPQDYAVATRWYRKAADQGYAKAQFNLGALYLRGEGVAKDYAEALRWIQRAADQNDARAEEALGFMYYNGQGVRQDYAQAAHWYQKAAEQGYPVAQQGLGFMYANGLGAPQDDAQAVVWYRKAAEQGDAVAEQSLGDMYANGRGVPWDQGEADRWYRKAADQGDARAKRALQSLESGSGPPTKTRYVEISAAVLGFSVGLWLSLGFLLPGRKLRDRRQSAIALLGVTFLLNAGLSLYAFNHDIRYSPHHDAFHLARGFLVATAILIIITVVLPGKRKRTETE